MLRVAINGFGRIGRMVLRAIYENQYKGLKVVAINNRAKPETSAFLLERDTLHGKFNLILSIQKMKSSSVRIKFNVTMKMILLIVHGMRKKLI